MSIFIVCFCDEYDVPQEQLQQSDVNLKVSQVVNHTKDPQVKKIIAHVRSHKSVNQQDEAVWLKSSSSTSGNDCTNIPRARNK